MLWSNPTFSNSSGTITIPNGAVTYNGVTFGSTAQLTCDSGYEPAAGASNRMCLNDGSWSQGIQSCVAVPGYYFFNMHIIIIIMYMVQHKKVTTVVSCLIAHIYLFMPWNQVLSKFINCMIN